MIKRMLLVLMIVPMLLCAAGCKGNETEKETPETQPSETVESSQPQEETDEGTETVPEETTESTVETTTEKEVTLLEGLDIQYPLYFWFSSGAGAWSTELTLNADGSFEGSFHDTNMGENAEEYPHGTTYVCNFSGLFADGMKLDEYSYSIQLKELSQEREKGEEWIEDGMRYIASDPYGLENCTEFRFYLPETPISLLSEEALFWWPLRFEEGHTVLDAYAIYNTTDESGFFALAEE